MMARIFGATLFFAASLPGRAGADGLGRIAWVAPTACDSSGVVEAKLDLALRARGILTPPSTRLASALVGATADGYALTLTLEQAAGAGRTSLQARTCEELVDAAVTLTTLAMDRVGKARAPVDEPNLAIAAEVPQKTAAVLPLSPSQSPDSRPARVTRDPDHDKLSAPEGNGGLKREISVALANRLGVLPGVATGVEAGVRLAWPNAAVGIAYSHLFPRDVQFVSVGVANFHLDGIDATACYAFPTERWRFEACGGLQTGMLFGESRQVTSPGADSLIWVGVSLGARVSVPRLWGPIALWAEIRGTPTIRRPSFYVGGIGPAYEAPWLSASSSIGFAAQF